jgi:ABC-type branched-subunit amino acid transport system substrate-binding protein
LQSLILAVGLACSLALVAGAQIPATAQDPLTAVERRGKQIYLQGKSPSGKDILAYLGDDSMELPGSAMACANCHGFDGQGKPEGGITPSNLSWEVLSKPYGLAHADGRKHPAYTERGLQLAITRGLDPGGNKLQNVMPRYQMSEQDLADLIAYLKRLGKDRDPGITENKITIGTALPATGALAEMGQSIKAVTTAFFTELNSQGGIYNRRVHLKFVETLDTPAGTRANVERLLKDDQVFAMSGAFIAGSEKEIIPLLAEQNVPLIGPFTLYPQTTVPLNREVFYLLSGVDDQARALVDFAAARPEFQKARLAVLHSQSEAYENASKAVKVEAEKKKLPPPQAYEYMAGRLDAAAIVKQIKPLSPEAVLFLGSPEELISLLQEAEKLEWFPAIFLPSANAGAGIFAAPAGFDGKLFFSFPTSPNDQDAEGLKEFRALAEKYQLPKKHLSAQISAYTAAKILVEALKRAGKDVSREKLIQVLEGLYEYRTGLTPAITYGPNRRIGARGAYVVTIDLKKQQFVPVGGWINLD